MRVLMLGWEFPPRVSGGLGTACRGITRGLMHAGTEVLFVLPSAHDSQAVDGLDLMGCDRVPIMEDRRWATSRAREAIGVRVQLDPYSGRSFGCFDSVADVHGELEHYTRAVGEIARARSFDVIHAHDWMSFPAGMFAKELAGTPLIAHVHSLESDRAGDKADPRIVAVERAGLEACDQIVCVSESTARAIRERYGIDGDRIRVVHNAVEARGSMPTSSSKRKGQCVLFMGRITQQKDPATFLEAAALVLRAVPTARFVLAGDGDLLPDMVELSLKLGLERAVRFTGFLGEAEVDAMYEHADVFVMPSRSEPFGLVSLEAMSHGVPVVATRGSGVLETLSSALVVEPGDAAGLAEQVVALLTQPELREAVLATGATEVRNASWERRGVELAELYAELVG